MPETVTPSSAAPDFGAAPNDRQDAHAASGTRTRSFGLVGYFDTPAQLYSACEALRDAGLRKFDAHTPFPVHGLEKAMGVKASKLPWIVLPAGIVGGVLAFLFQSWAMGVDYPLIIAGKPYFALPAYIPVTFEVTILFSALATFVGTWALNRLPAFYHPVFRHPDFGRATDDKFFISVEASDPKFDADAIRRLLANHGVQELQEVQS